MSTVTNSTLNEQIYKVHTGEGLINSVARINIVLMPRAICVAGFSDRGDLLMIKYNDYKRELPPWIIDFYEHQFLNEQMLGAPHKVTSVFIASEKNMVVPEVLHKQQESSEWLRKIHFVEGNEVINDHHLREDKAFYVYAWPSAAKSLVNRYFTKARVIPFATYQFYKPFKAESALQCGLTNGYAFATLYKDRELTWHQSFEFSNAEDVAYQIKLAMKEFGVPNDMLFQCTTICKMLTHNITGLMQYFPALKDGTGNVVSNDRSWVSTIYLLQQLYACAL